MLADELKKAKDKSHSQILQKVNMENFICFLKYLSVCLQHIQIEISSGFAG